MVAIGSFTVRLARAGVHWWDGGAFFGVVPKTLWNPLLPADELNRIPAAFNCYFIETSGQRILIETGGGERHDAKARERMQLPPGSGVVPVDPASIDIVVNSHLHWDHCSGNTLDSPGGPGPPHSPTPQYFAQRGELDHARKRLPRDAVSYRDINYQPLLDTGRMTLLDGDSEIAPGVHMLVTPGHNRDMCIVLRPLRRRNFLFFGRT